MSYKKNIVKEEMIDRLGVTTGLPLFESAKSPSPQVPPSPIHLPDWIWDGNSVKAETYQLMKDKFADDSVKYLKALIEKGGSATDHEMVEYFHNSAKWPLHIVCARRNYWTGEPFHIIKAFPNKVKLSPHNRKRTVWYVIFSNLYKIIKSEV